jgi:hypothetical protein
MLSLDVAYLKPSANPRFLPGIESGAEGESQAGHCLLSTSLTGHARTAKSSISQHYHFSAEFLAKEICCPEQDIMTASLIRNEDRQPLSGLISRGEQHAHGS